MGPRWDFEAHKLQLFFFKEFVMKSVLKGLVISSLMFGATAQAEVFKDVIDFNANLGEGFLVNNGDFVEYTHDLTEITPAEQYLHLIDNVFDPAKGDENEMYNITRAYLGFSFVSSFDGTASVDVDDIAVQLVADGTFTFSGNGFGNSGDLGENDLAVSLEGIGQLNEDGTLTVRVTRTDAAGFDKPYQLKQARLIAYDAPLNASAVAMVLSGLGLAAFRRKKFL